MKLITKSNAGKPVHNRIDNLVAVINAMRKREMSVADIGDVLGYSKSGAHKYCKELLIAQVIQIVRYVPGRTSCRLDKPMYELVEDTGFIQSYIDTIQRIGLESQAKIRSNGVAKLHVMHDDAVFKVKRAKMKAPEHTDLMAAFFGMKTA